MVAGTLRKVTRWSCSVVGTGWYSEGDAGKSLNNLGQVEWETSVRHIMDDGCLGIVRGLRAE